MGLFDAFATVVEWQEYREGVIFWKWNQKEIKKNSRLVVKPGQAALVLVDGKLDGVYTDEGTFNIGASTNGKREVLFINKKEMNMQWGTKNPIMVPCPTVPGGVPIRGFGTYLLKVGLGMDDLTNMVDNVAGIKDVYTVEDVRIRVDAVLDQMLMKWITSAGQDLTNLQANSEAICRGLREDLDYEMIKIGLTIVDFRASSFSYPKELQSQLMQAATSNMAKQAMNNMNPAYNPAYTSTYNPAYNPAPDAPKTPKFCPNCGTALTPGVKFCPNCGAKVG